MSTGKWNLQIYYYIISRKKKIKKKLVFLGQNKNKASVSSKKRKTNLFYVHSAVYWKRHFSQFKITAKLDCFHLHYNPWDRYNPLLLVRDYSLLPVACHQVKNVE